MSVVLYGQFVTAPHPWKPSHTHGADQGQVGWRLHMVPVDETGHVEKRAPALCGLMPRHGWGGDLFIEDECKRCEAAAARREKLGDTFVNQHDVLSERRKKEEHARFLAEEGID